jgi:hypothetical protein
MTKREKTMNLVLRSPSTTVDTERSERMEKGVNPSRPKKMKINEKNT